MTLPWPESCPHLIERRALSLCSVADSFLNVDVVVLTGLVEVNGAVGQRINLLVCFAENLHQNRVVTELFNAFLALICVFL